MPEEQILQNYRLNHLRLSLDNLYDENQTTPAVANALYQLWELVRAQDRQLQEQEKLLDVLKLRGDVVNNRLHQLEKDSPWLAPPPTTAQPTKDDPLDAAQLAILREREEQMESTIPPTPPSSQSGPVDTTIGHAVQVLRSAANYLESASEALGKIAVPAAEQQPSTSQRQGSPRSDAQTSAKSPSNASDGNTTWERGGAWT